MVSLLYSIGATRNHMDFFKKHRAARIDHYVIEVNKLIIRLEKVRTRINYSRQSQVVCQCGFDTYSSSYTTLTVRT